LRLVIITSCTGLRSATHPRRLTAEDFRKGAEHVATRELELSDVCAPAEELYSGLQHQRLMRGVKSFRCSQERQGSSLDLWIVSAGYGIIPGDRRIAPYEASFAELRKARIRAWADFLGIPVGTRRVLERPYDLGLVLLGDAYLEACSLDTFTRVRGPTLLLCGSHSAERVPSLPSLRTVVLSTDDAKRFSCGIVGLKGEVAARVLTRLAHNPQCGTMFFRPEMDLLGELAETSR
jgi:hypothetical protein